MEYYLSIRTNKPEPLFGQWLITLGGDNMTKSIDNVGNYILWIGGIDDHYENFDDAEMAKFEWEAKGYDDVYIETREELLKRDN
jgi:hypothetical protein